jgi:hypothetical protein
VTGRPFRFRIRDSGHGESIALLRNGDEVKSASYERFVRFYADWRSGCRTPNDYRNDGREQSKAQVIYFLLSTPEHISPFPPE